MQLIKGDLLEGEWDFACHVVNSYITMGSGVAYFLRKKWPQIYQADLDHNEEWSENHVDDKLGTFSFAPLDDHRGVYNLYAMWGIGNDGNPLHRNCSYDALYNAMFRMCSDITKKHPLMEKVNVGVPYLMGCCRAGGSWKIVESILTDLEEYFEEITFVIYQFSEFEVTAQSTQPT